MVRQIYYNRFMLTVCVQAGGKSSRLGKDKALLDFGGQPLIQYVLSQVASLADETMITTNHPEGYRFLGLPLVPDLIRDRGALGGLYTALSAASHPLVAVVACDLPFANADLLAHCRDLLLADASLDVVIPSTKHGLEPLHAVYRRETCRPAVKAAIEADQWRMIAWHSEVKIRVLTPEESATFDPDGLVFWNLNTPEDFQAALERLYSSSG
jgi:molybdopterin-guanine dinucleotide biosynthesis protein A